ncbi:MAG: hypothetical protein KAH03_07450 [Cocleimonas sp.]|nr:hypothetical protein [Cocleimonas sp.]
MNSNKTDRKLHIIVNDTAILAYDRKKLIPDEQQNYLDQMDKKMNAGITLGNDKIENPNTLQRAQYIANSLISALFREDYNLGMAMCTYLANRIPDLQQVKAIGEKDEMSVEFVFDRSLEKAQQEQKIEFYNPNSTDTTTH